jgi:hypothetical protein
MVVHFEIAPAHPATTSLSSNEDQRAQCSHLVTRHMRRTAVHKQRAAAPLQPHRNGYDARPKSHDRSQPPTPPLAPAAPPAPWWVASSHKHQRNTISRGASARAESGTRADPLPRSPIPSRATGRHPCSRARTTARTDLSPQAGVVPAVWRVLPSEVLHLQWRGCPTSAGVPHHRRHNRRSWR